MTTEEVNALGDTLVAADCDGDEDRFHAAAYDLLRSLAVEHERADNLAARVHSLAGASR